MNDSITVTADNEIAVADFIHSHDVRRYPEAAFSNHQYLIGISLQHRVVVHMLGEDDARVLLAGDIVSATADHHITITRLPPSNAIVCPECGSRDADCTSDRKAHTHRCNTCGYETVAKAVAKRIWRTGYWIAHVPSKNFKRGSHAIVMKGSTVAFDPSPGKRYRTGRNMTGTGLVTGGHYFVVDDPSLLCGRVHGRAVSSVSCEVEMGEYVDD